MKQSIFNFSPRGKESNSNLIAEWLNNGIESAGKEKADIFPLIPLSGREKLLSDFIECDRVIVIFPLYVDNAPAPVLDFFNRLEEKIKLSSAKKTTGKEILFVIHSGFPEAVHCQTLPLWLEKLSGKLGYKYLGTIINPGTEAIRSMKSDLLKKRREAFENIGRELIHTGKVDLQSAEDLMPLKRFNLPARILLHILTALRVIDIPINSMCRKNGSYKKRFDRPYAPGNP